MNDADSATSAPAPTMSTDKSPEMSSDIASSSSALADTSFASSSSLDTSSISNGDSFSDAVAQGASYDRASSQEEQASASYEASAGEQASASYETSVESQASDSYEASASANGDSLSAERLTSSEHTKIMRQGEEVPNLVGSSDDYAGPSVSATEGEETLDTLSEDEVSHEGFALDDAPAIKELNSNTTAPDLNNVMPSPVSGMSSGIVASSSEPNQDPSSYAPDNAHGKPNFTDDVIYDFKSAGEALCYYREQRGYSKQQVAAMIQTRVTTVADLEHDRLNTSTDASFAVPTIVKYCAILNIDNRVVLNLYHQNIAEQLSVKHLSSPPPKSHAGRNWALIVLVIALASGGYFIFSPSDDDKASGQLALEQEGLSGSLTYDGNGGFTSNTAANDTLAAGQGAIGNATNFANSATADNMAASGNLASLDNLATTENPAHIGDRAQTSLDTATSTNTSASALNGSLAFNQESSFNERATNAAAAATADKNRVAQAASHEAELAKQAKSANAPNSLVLANNRPQAAPALASADTKSNNLALAATKAKEQAEAQAKELAEVKAKELAVAQAKEQAEAKAKELALTGAPKAQEKANPKAPELKSKLKDVSKQVKIENRDALGSLNRVQIKVLADVALKVMGENGKVLRSGTFKAGDEIDITGIPPITVQISDTKAVRISYSGGTVATPKAEQATFKLPMR